MSDQYESVRSLSLAAVAPTLGLDLTAFKKRKGGELYGPCPVHQPKANQTSFCYAADGRWHCFSCAAKGRGVIDLTMQVLHIGFKEAVALLEGIKPPDEPQERVLGHSSEPGAQPDGNSARFGSVQASSSSKGQIEDTNSEVALVPLKSSYHKFAVACEWLEARISDMTVRDRFGVFCYNNPQRKSVYSGKVMIPITKDGELYGYLARSIEGEPKYLFPKGFPKHLFLFGQDQITEPHRVLYLVESPFTVMKFASLGVPALSPYGWSVSPEQLDILCGLTKGLIYLPDRNKYQEGKAVVSLLASKLWVKYPQLPEGVDDPEHLTKEQILAL